MKITRILAAALVLSSITLSGAAHASLVKNYSGDDVNMGTVAYGQSGTISNFFSSLSGSEDEKSTSGTVFGYLPTMSRIDFTYTMAGTNTLVNFEVESYGSYDYTTHTPVPHHSTINTRYHGYSFYDSSGEADDGYASSHVNVGYTNNKPSLMLVWAFAHLSTGAPTTASGVTTTPVHGNTWVQNNSSSLAYFNSTFEGAIKEIEKKIESQETPLGLTGTLTYRVSAIPLPPALPLFAVLIAGMVGFVRLSRKRNAVAVAA